MKIKNIGEIKKSITEKNVPTDPEKWAYAKAQAKKKFDVYPSAYANGWASKKYKELGGSWRKEESVTEGDESSPEETLMGLKEMAKGDLERIGDYSKMILDRLNSGEELDSWMYSQITLAVDQLNSVHDAMDGNDGVVESIDEVDVNDPMMVKLRAAQMQRKADALKKAQPKKYTINPDWEAGKNAKKIHILKKQRAQIMRDMEQEAEPSGGRIADKYGRMLDKIDKEIIKLGGNPMGESVNESNEPEIITQLRDVMKTGYKNVNDPKSGKKIKVDSFSASAIVKVYDALNQTNKDKFSNMGLVGMQNVAFKVLNK
jgi:hypothetical protein